MDISEWTLEKENRFQELHKRLVSNRQQIPVEVLQTKYRAAYSSLTSELVELADLFAECYYTVLAFPIHPKDTAGNEWLTDKCEAIKGGKEKDRRQRYKEALVDQLDMQAYYDLVDSIQTQMEADAFGPYWQRHCRWIGPEGNRWIYNDIKQLYWYPPCEQWPEGCWIDKQRVCRLLRWPPRIGG